MCSMSANYIYLHYFNIYMIFFKIKYILRIIKLYELIILQINRSMFKMHQPR